MNKYTPIVCSLTLILFVACGGDNSPTNSNPDTESTVTSGTLDLTISSTGSDIDEDGYVLSINDTSSQNVQTDEKVTISDLSEGNHQVELSDLSKNCSVNGDNPVTISITAGQTTTNTLSVDCKDILENEIAFHSNRDGDYEIFVMNANGSNPRQLTNNSYSDKQPVISHDGMKIAFTSSRNGTHSIFVMNADGSNIQKVTDYTPPRYDKPVTLSWSLDDRKLIYSGIYQINIDGSDKETIQEGIDPHYSPNGEKIAMVDEPLLYTMNYDGTGLKQITTYNSKIDTVRFPRWSPDGDKFVVSHLEEGYYNIYTINTDGTGGTHVFGRKYEEEKFPSWSPDGQYLIFETDRDNNKEIYRINSDGSGTVTNLTANPAEDGGAFWSPVK